MKNLIIGTGKLGKSLARVLDPNTTMSVHHDGGVFDPPSGYEAIEEYEPDRIFICCANTDTRGDYGPAYQREINIVIETLSYGKIFDLYTFGTNYESCSLSNAYIDSKKALRFLHRCTSRQTWRHITLSNLYETETQFLARFPDPCKIPRGTLIEPLNVDDVAAKILTLTEPGEYHFRGIRRPLTPWLIINNKRVTETDDPVEFPIDWAALGRGVLGKQVYL